MKHIFIINPTSGRGLATQLIPTIESHFAHKDEPFEIIITEYKGHATAIAKRYFVSDHVILYSIGGDGTAYEILNGLNDHVSMAIVPAGTGNDYYRMLGIEPDKIEKILIDTIEGKMVKVDYGVANQVRFMNCTTMGLDADVNEKSERIGKKLPIPRSLVYIVSALITVIKPKTIDLEIDINGQKIIQRSLLVAVMNGRWYGGGFQPAPMASIQDGKLDVCLVSNASLFRILFLLPRYFKGTHVNVKEVTFIQSEQFTLTTRQMTRIGSDGEVSMQNKIVFRLMKKALNLKVPKNSTLQEEL